MSTESKRPLGLKVQTFADFLETNAPGSRATVRDFSIPAPVGTRPSLSAPQLLLDCEGEECNGLRHFAGIVSPDCRLYNDGQIGAAVFLHYVCCNCSRTKKSYAIFVETYGTSKLTVVKVGEWPPFGPRVPARVISLIGPDRELFSKGRLAENQGLGIGAFAYYRRVIENQKDRLLGKIIEVAQRVGALQTAWLNNWRRPREKLSSARRLPALRMPSPIPCELTTTIL